MKKHIPNMLTLGNLLCGCLGIIHIVNGDLYTGAIFVFPALIFDFLDGFVARLLNVSSPIGKELDSLADMVTFGVLPGVLLISLLSQHQMNLLSFDYEMDTAIQYLGLLFPAFAALRLAKFNVDESQSDSFVGIPTPAATMFVVGLLFLFDIDFLINENGKLMLAIVAIIISLAMVAPFRMISLKFKTYGVKENIFRYLLIVLALTSILIFKLGGLSVTILVYICLSLLQNAVTKKPIS